MIKLVIPSLTVNKRKNRCIPYIYWAAAIFAVVTNYSNLFFSEAVKNLVSLESESF